MKIEEIEIQGFRSFRDAQTLVFPQKSGLFKMSGLNEAELSLGANGAGKSSVWDALSWAFFGMTARKVKGAHVENWSKDVQCRVRIVFEIDRTRYELVRTRKPNQILIGDVCITQEEVEDLIGLNHAMFLSSVLMSQFGEFFFDLGPTDKLNLFSQLLDLDLWVRASKRASEILKKCDARIRKSENEEAAIHARIGVLEEHLGDLKAKSETFEDDRKTKIEHAKAELEEVEKSQARVVRAVDRQKRAYTTVKKAVVELDKKVERHRAKQTQLAMAKNDLDHEVNILQGDLDKMLHKYAQIEQLSVCSKCGQELKKHAKTEMLAKMDREIEEHRETIRLRRDRRDRKNRELVAQAKTTKEQLAKLSETEEKKDQVRDTLDDLKRKDDVVRNRIASLQQDLSGLRQAKDPHAAEAIGVTKRLKKCRKQMRDLLEDLRIERATMDALSYWPKGFKDVRLWIVENALKELEIAVNNNLVELGLADWTVVLDAERATSTGGVSRGFTVAIRPPDHQGKPVPWEAWSGGETQRLRIAGAAGLSDLIEARTNLAPTFEVWDEPTAHLSTEGIDDLLRWFEERAARTGRTIWLVDHRSLDAGQFTGSIRVIRDDRGSRLAAATWDAQDRPSRARAAGPVG